MANHNLKLTGNLQFYILMTLACANQGYQELVPINQVHHLAERNRLQEYHHYYKAVTIAMPILIHGGMGVFGSKERMGA